MVYAHYEGFCKFCWTLLLGSIERRAFLRKDLAPPLARRAMKSVFCELRGDTSDENLWKFGFHEFGAELLGPATFPDEIETESNLWPSVAKKINASVGMCCASFDTHESDLKQLVGRRNKIAHGEKLEISNLTQLQQLEHAATLAMHDLALAVLDCLEKKSYLNPAPSINN